MNVQGFGLARKRHGNAIIFRHFYVSTNPTPHLISQYLTLLERYQPVYVS